MSITNQQINEILMPISEELKAMAESREIDKRHKKYKQRAKNLAGLKGAYKSALEYERVILTQRLDEINEALDQDAQDRKELHEDWLDD